MSKCMGIEAYQDDIDHAPDDTEDRTTDDKRVGNASWKKGSSSG